MELVLTRSYGAEGTNGVLCHEQELICYTIELPWRNNLRGRSCVPEGRYALVRRYSQKFHWHLHLTDVPGRALVLLHPANDARKELKGCIAPVCALTGPGRGLYSRVAFERLQRLALPVLQEGKPVYLTIKHSTNGIAS